MRLNIKRVDLRSLSSSSSTLSNKSLNSLRIFISTHLEQCINIRTPINHHHHHHIRHIDIPSDCGIVNNLKRTSPSLSSSSSSSSTTITTTSSAEHSDDYTTKYVNNQKCHYNNNNNINQKINQSPIISCDSSCNASFSNLT